MIEFIANLPPIQSAILIDGQGDGARIKLDISRQYMPQVLELQKLAGKVFKIKIEPEEEWACKPYKADIDLKTQDIKLDVK